MVSIYHEGQITAARNASDLVGKLGQCEDDQIRRTQNCT